jgi:hypothetical protein
MYYKNEEDMKKDFISKGYQLLDSATSDLQNPYSSVYQHWHSMSADKKHIIVRIPLDDSSTIAIYSYKGTSI